MSDQNNPTGAGATTAGSAAKDAFEATKTQVRHAADDLRAAAESKARELRSAAEAKADELRGRAEDYYGQARERVRTFQDDGEAYVRENPMRAVGLAVGAGFVLGLLFRK